LHEKRRREEQTPFTAAGIGRWLSRKGQAEEESLLSSRKKERVAWRAGNTRKKGNRKSLVTKPVIVSDVRREKLNRTNDEERGARKEAPPKHWGCGKERADKKEGAGR